MSRLVGRIILTVGLAIGAGGAYCYWSTQNFLHTSLHSTGKVVELRGTAKGAYAPIVQFETADHAVITAVGRVGSNPPAHKVSDTVTVLYQADSPQEIILDEPLDLWLPTCIFVGLGSIFIIVGGSLLGFSRKQA